MVLASEVVVMPLLETSGALGVRPVYREAVAAAGTMPAAWFITAIAAGAIRTRA